jgi:hypothetical protein
MLIDIVITQKGLLTERRMVFSMKSWRVFS